MPRSENCWCEVPNPRPVDVDPECPKHGDGHQAYGRRTDTRPWSLDSQRLGPGRESWREGIDG
jgi:hypothetical protein